MSRSFGDDFGQRIDLAVRIREILRNYPEGTSIVKELVQNADDAGARTVAICVDARRHAARSCASAAAEELQGPALLCYNDALFREADFASIQRLGDSVKRSDTTKTGRFGIGFNSVYHLTEVPSFASGSKVVWFDPQCAFLPDVDPRNPGKMVDILKNPDVLRSSADMFAGFDGAFGWTGGESYAGTLFRLPLRTEEQAKTSKLSDRHHTAASLAPLLGDVAAQAAEMLLFLKAVERVAVYKWAPGAAKPELVHEAAIRDVTPQLRHLRAAPLRGPAPATADFALDIADGSDRQSWVVRGQMGGKTASVLAARAAARGDKLLPWAAVAARPDVAKPFDGRAYCFLPLPRKTGLKNVHVNGFFELSSNRRDLWAAGAEDERGGAADARGAWLCAWNAALLADVAAPCLGRALEAAANSPGAGALWPDATFFKRSRAPDAALWRVFGAAALADVRDTNRRCLRTATGKIVAPADAIVVPPPAGAFGDGPGVPADRPERDAVVAKAFATDSGVARRRRVRRRARGARARDGRVPRGPRRRPRCDGAGLLRGARRRRRAAGTESGLALLLLACRHLGDDWAALDGCRLLPLNGGGFGVLAALPPSRPHLEAMGFSPAAALAPDVARLCLAKGDGWATPWDADAAPAAESTFRRRPAGGAVRLKQPDGAPLAQDDLDLALRLVFALGADASLTAEKCVDMDVVAPDEAGALRPCRELVFDDAPWLRDAKADFRVTHPTVAAAHAKKLGARSLRRALLDRGLAAGAEKASIFGDNVETEAFGQRESLTRRLAHILQLYPEGSGILNELVQNADDAGASEVRVLLDARSAATRGAQSLLSAGLAAWQGPALCVSNDAGFTESDWRNLVRVGQGSKLENFKTTGRFGLGFNSVYHLTDVPQVASGDHVLFLDPHADGLVPGATPQRPGLRVKFTGGADLPAAFPDQFASWADCGCDLEKPLEGTLFRLPLRSRAAAATSEISKQHYGVEEAEALLEQFKAQATSVLLFLRHVRAVTVTVLRDGGESETVFRAAAREDPLGSPDVDGAAVLAGENPRASADDPLAALGGATKAEFYARLLATPEASLPRRLAKVTVAFEARGAVAVEAYAVSSCVGGGAARAMACAPEHAGHKFVPFGGVAARLGAAGGGRCYTFLPVPVRTGLPVDVNGYFELSSNRRDVWHGEDMAGAGRLKSEWNVALLRDVVAVAYARLLLALGAAGADLWPLEAGAGPCWDACRAAVFDEARELPLLTTDLDGGRAIEPKRCVAARAEDGAIADLLLLERLPVVALEPALHAALVASKCVGAECSPKFVRAFYAKSGATYAAGHARAGQRRASLATPEGVAALCAYALADAPADVAALPFNLTVDGSLGLLGGDGPVVSVADPATPEFRILEPVVPRVLAHAAVAPVLLAKLPKTSDATRAAPPDAAAVGRAVAKARFDAPPGDVVAWDPPAAGAGSRAWVGDVWAWLAANDAKKPSRRRTRSRPASPARVARRRSRGSRTTRRRSSRPRPSKAAACVAGSGDLGARWGRLTRRGRARGDEHPRALRDWLAEAAAAGGALDGLPEAKIFKVLGSHRHAAPAAALRALPPPCVDAALLNAAAADLDVLEESDRGSRDLLRALKWPRLDDEAFFARAAPAVADADCLHECPAALAAAHGPLLRALGVREAFDAADFARALREGFPGGEPLGESRAAARGARGAHRASGFESVDELEAAVGGDVLAPDSEGRLAPARRLAVEATQAVPCPAAPAAGDALEAALPDVLAAADGALGARSVALVFDARTHGAASLVHPALAGAQGPALVLWVDHDGPVGTEALVRLLSPGAAAVGRGLAGAFSLSDCLFALNRDTLHVFDPSGAFLDDGGGEKRPPGPAGRRYQLGDGDLMRKFPNQFEPFAHLPFGVSERGIAAGTILRLPLRGDFFVDGELDVPRVDGLLRSFEAGAERALLFGHALAGVTTHVFSGGNALLPRFSATRSGEKLLPRDGSGSASPGDARRRLLASDRAWLPKSKVGAFLGGLGAAQVFRPPALLYEFRVVVATYDGDGGCASRADAWLALGVLAPSAALREAAAAARDRVGRDADAPLVTLAAKVDGECDGAARLSARGADAGVDLAGVLPNVFVDAPVCVDGDAPATFSGGALERKREVDFEDPHAVALFGDLPLIPLEGGGALACRHRDAVVASRATCGPTTARRAELAALARAADAARREAAADEAAADAAEDELERRRCAEMGEDRRARARPRPPRKRRRRATRGGADARGRPRPDAAPLRGAARLGAPILEARYWPPDRRGAVVARQANGALREGEGAPAGDLPPAVERDLVDFLVEHWDPELRRCQPSSTRRQSRGGRGRRRRRAAAAQALYTDHALATDDGLLASLAPVAFVPCCDFAGGGGVVDDFSSFDALVAPGDRRVAWLGAKVLRPATRRRGSSQGDAAVPRARDALAGLAAESGDGDARTLTASAELSGFDVRYVSRLETAVALDAGAPAAAARRVAHVDGNGKLYVFPRTAAAGDDAADAPPPPPRAAPRAADAADAPDDGARAPPPPPGARGGAPRDRRRASRARARRPSTRTARRCGASSTPRGARSRPRGPTPTTLPGRAARPRARERGAVREPPAEFLCAITRECMVDPVIAADGFSYERSAIERWFRAKRTSPQTNAPLASTALVPNIALRGLIEGFHEGR
ncbi:sacsin [Aureococcus anophagefferens]|uniref:Sacsin n=1 Tax=Aureococcus anophagefferens TaxID=44056 RepID=A0ABR1G2T0_AURAN